MTDSGNEVLQPTSLVVKGEERESERKSRIL